MPKSFRLLVIAALAALALPTTASADVPAGADWTEALHRRRPASRRCTSTSSAPRALKDDRQDAGHPRRSARTSATAASRRRTTRPARTARPTASTT